MSHEDLDPVDDWSVFFNYSWAEMGLFDTPAHLLKIKEVLEDEKRPFSKVTYVGYDLGATQILYGLAHRERDFYSEHLAGAIALAPCIKISAPMGGSVKVSRNFDLYSGY
jgi:hypothetical protein